MATFKKFRRQQTKVNRPEQPAFALPLSFAEVEVVQVIKALPFLDIDSVVRNMKRMISTLIADNDRREEGRHASVMVIGAPLLQLGVDFIAQLFDAHNPDRWFDQKHDVNIVLQDFNSAVRSAADLDQTTQVNNFTLNMSKLESGENRLYVILVDEESFVDAFTVFEGHPVMLEHRSLFILPSPSEYKKALRTVSGQFDFSPVQRSLIGVQLSAKSIDVTRSLAISAARTYRYLSTLHPDLRLSDPSSHVPTPKFSFGGSHFFVYARLLEKFDNDENMQRHLQGVDEGFQSAEEAVRQGFLDGTFDEASDEPTSYPFPTEEE
jgi:hypothetical protein